MKAVRGGKTQPAEAKEKLQILAFHHEDNGVAYYRIKQPYQTAHAYFNGVLTKVAPMSQFEETIGDPDYRNFHAIAITVPTDPQLFAFFELLQGTGKKIIVDIDDDYWNLPKGSWAASQFPPERVQVLTTFVKNADLVTVSTPELAEVVKHFTSKIHINYNTVFPLENTTREKERNRLGFAETDKVIMWGGGAQHLPDLRIAAEAVKDILEAEPNAIFFYYGDPDLFNTLGFTEKHRTKVQGWTDYYTFWESILAADCFIAPVTYQLYNRSKSELKCLETARVGVQCICSDIAPYKRFYEKFGMADYYIVKGNKKEGWKKQITQALANPGLPEVLKNFVKQHYNPITETQKLLERIAQVMEEPGKKLKEYEEKKEEFFKKLENEQ